MSLKPVLPLALIPAFLILTPSAQAQQESRIAVSGLAATSNLQRAPAATPAPGAPIHITFALKGSRIAQLERFISSQHDPSSSNYNNWLLPNEVGERFGAPDADINAVLQYAASQHLTVTVWPNRMFVSAVGTRAQLEQVFGVVISGYVRDRSPETEDLSPTFYAPDREPQVPASIASRLSGIFGLSSYPQMRHSRRAMRRAPSPQATGGSGLTVMPAANPSPTPQFSSSLGPSQVSKVYDFDGMHSLGLTGTGMTIGIYSPTNVYDSDIQYFCSFYGLGVPTIVHTPIDGGATDYAGVIEASLDSQVILGQTPKATIEFYESPNDGDFDVWNRITSDNLSVISDSWAFDESTLHIKDQADSYVAALDAIMATMDAQGQSHFNATGDNGAYQGYRGVLSVSYPASSWHVTATGGTQLFGDSNGNYLSENAWSGGGGGLSIYFARPPWQTGPGVINSYSNGNRQIPDVASLADDATPGYFIYEGGHWYSAGGTSAAAPLWSAANLLFNQELIQVNGKRTGVLNTGLYGLGGNYSTQPGAFCFHDVTTGNNGYYSSTAGWDFTTGWGSADFTKLMYDWLENYEGQSLVDLLPYTPTTATPLGTFTKPLMISTSATSIVEPSTFNPTTTYYFFADIANGGSADSVRANNSLQIDGANHTFAMGPFASDYYYYAPLAYSTKLSPGNHTIKLIVNSDGLIKESNTANDTFSRTISVSGVALSSLTMAPNSITGGDTSVGTVTIAGPALSTPTVVELASSNSAVLSVPASVTIPAGQTVGTFVANSQSVAADTPVTITATIGSSIQTASVTVNRATITQLLLSPTTLKAGQLGAGIVTLTGRAPAGGLVVTLTDSNTAAAKILTTVNIPAGSKSQAFAYQAYAVRLATPVTFTASVNGGSKSATLTVEPSNP